MEPLPVAEGIRPIPVPALPPYNGFGSFEDSEQSCKNLVSRHRSLKLKSAHRLLIADILRAESLYVQAHKMSRHYSQARELQVS